MSDETNSPVLTALDAQDVATVWRMSAERVRLIGGPLSGQAVWVEAGKTSLQVHIAAREDRLTRTLEYRREGLGLLFVGEVAQGDLMAESVIARAGPPGPRSGQKP
jgi:hypothetical protein